MFGGYYDWLDIFFIIQVVQCCDVGFNFDLNGGLDIDAFELNIFFFEMFDYFFVEFQQMRLFQIQYIGQIVMQCVQVVFGFIS